MPSAATSRRGFALNCRFAVNGIQNASRLFGTAVVVAESSVSYMGTGSDRGLGSGWYTTSSEAAKLTRPALRQKAKASASPGAFTAF